MRPIETLNAIPSALVANGAPNYPVLIFSHGRGGFRQRNTFARCVKQLA